jgi:Family of unknown function (DUF5681)
MPFKKGQSGNPGGRPPKSRALTEILSKTGDRKVDVAGKKVSSKQLIALLLWEIATTGRAIFPDKTELEVSPRDWLETVKWLFGQIDGPPPRPEPDRPDEDDEDEDTGEMVVTVKYESSEEGIEKESEEPECRTDSSQPAQVAEADQA